MIQIICQSVFVLGKNNSNHHGNHFLGFLALVEEKNQNPFTKLHTLVSTIKWQSINKKQNFGHSIIPLTKLNGLWQALLTAMF